MGECLGRFESCWHIFKKTSSIEIGECWGESVCGVDFLRAGVGQVSPQLTVLSSTNASAGDLDHVSSSVEVDWL